MMMKSIGILCALVLTTCVGLSSQTMGLFLQTPDSYNGYTLLSPSVSKNTFLIDNCGKLIHEWTSSFSPGLSAYLLENGDLLRTARIPSTINGGGSGGRIERISWDDELLWTVTFSNEEHQQHHDIEMLPNGNILVIAWEVVPMEDVIMAGRQSIGGFGFWSCLIAELEPQVPNGANIVWEWRAFDHLIQDVDSNLENFGVISEHPERIDINVDPSQSADWLHVNGIDYNAELDQIVLSVHDLHEIWVIDHSTTTAEAVGSTGGRYGKGGDLLYRWGNPQNYQRGTSDDRILFGQHDARWIENGRPGQGAFMVFNNGINRPNQERYSTVDVWYPPIDSSGNYLLLPDQPYGPDDVDWRYGDIDKDFYSSRISGAQRQPNGNTLICVGRDGHIIEVDSAGELVWEYINPVGSIRHTQGTSPGSNDLFRSERYSPDYPAFANRDLTPGDPLEIDPLDYECEIYTSTYDVFQDQIEVIVFPNPATHHLVIEAPPELINFFSIYDVSGMRLNQGYLPTAGDIDISDLPNGLYFLIVEGPNLSVRVTKHFVIFR